MSGNGSGVAALAGPCSAPIAGCETRKRRAQRCAGRAMLGVGRGSDGVGKGAAMLGSGGTGGGGVGDESWAVGCGGLQPLSGVGRRELRVSGEAKGKQTNGGVEARRSFGDQRAASRASEGCCSGAASARARARSSGCGARPGAAVVRWWVALGDHRERRASSELRRRVSASCSAGEEWIWGR
ncbi:glycine-rich protein 1-like [Eucalyptus grandis]|uniref:glycine-rich protein 1-like n=1 Tax=Eucalyptus grandis TaxID=71139 RepID=UPI00192EA2A2|nr:glycine-rich protein 1-like [Eucalyptus grandis]